MRPILFFDDARRRRYVLEHQLLVRQLLARVYAAAAPDALVAAGAELREAEVRFAEDMHALRPEADPEWLEIWRMFKCPPTHTEEEDSRAARRRLEAAAAERARDLDLRRAFERALGLPRDDPARPA